MEENLSTSGFHHMMQPKFEINSRVNYFDTIKIRVFTDSNVPSHFGVFFE